MLTNVIFYYTFEIHFQGVRFVLFSGLGFSVQRNSLRAGGLSYQTARHIISNFSEPYLAKAASAYTIIDDPTGGDCQLVGNWTTGLKKCSLVTGLRRARGGKKT